MKRRFHLIESPDEAVVQQLADRDPENLFLTVAVMRGMKLRGMIPCLLGLWEDGRLLTGCLGAYKKGRLSRSLDIRFLPELPADSPFWPGLLAACQRLGVWELSLYAVSPQPRPIPPLGLVTFAEAGTEFYLKTGDAPPPAPSSSNHRRSIAKANKSGVTVHRTTAEAAIDIHLAMMGASMDRRMARGEDIGGNAEGQTFLAILEAGGGEFFQARDGDGTVLSSVFFLRSKAAAYYQSAGTSPLGMSLGASPFLIWNAADILHKEGVTKFCVGGSTPDNTGLVRFKSGFGCLEESFQAVTFSTIHPLKRRLRTLLQMLKTEPMSLVRGLFFIDHYPVYASEARAVPVPEVRPELVLEKLADDRLIELCRRQPEFHRQAERLAEFGFNDAWGLLQGDELVHVSWMVTPEHDRLCAERNIRLQGGEVEITHCFTSDSQRGRGLYPHAIRLLCQQATAMGFKRVLMITHHTNTASRRGIEKAGLIFTGTVRQVRSPLLSPSSLLTLRGHR
ncbi:MAG: hypothetical protein JWO94_1154 [Verrucomicrobiaceae bacterium]|nr:hypothetical protein [Verrucomicrobiaceae bacterium]